MQQFYFFFTDGTDTINETYSVIYCKQSVRSAADLASSSYITNYLLTSSIQAKKAFR